MINLKNEITAYNAYCEKQKKLSQHTIKHIGLT